MLLPVAGRDPGVGNRPAVQLRLLLVRVRQVLQLPLLWQQQHGRVRTMLTKVQMLQQQTILQRCLVAAMASRQNPSSQRKALGGVPAAAAATAPGGSQVQQDSPRQQCQVVAVLRGHPVLLLSLAAGAGAAAAALWAGCCLLPVSPVVLQQLQLLHPAVRPPIFQRTSLCWVPPRQMVLPALRLLVHQLQQALQHQVLWKLLVHPLRPLL